ncbi:hypothetical protein [Pyrobaculum aerophilum]|uniref:hypothetical protein n=1 Tax=Pyrobaculum aerophilum TaxID=13773 RepID=UPI0015F24A58|nr:hypothetical protein [Pyrobaculum aerophilum]
MDEGVVKPTVLFPLNCWRIARTHLGRNAYGGEITSSATFLADKSLKRPALKSPGKLD